MAESARCLGHALQPLEGNALDLKQVCAAVHGAEVVICTLGPVKRSPPHLCSRATWQVLEAMSKERVGRLVMVTGAMAGPPENLSGFYRAMLRVPWVARVIEDRRRQEALVKQSLIGWTLVRPPRLTDEDTPGDPEVTQRAVIGALDHASRRHVAETLMRAATTGAWRGMGVYVRS